MDLVVKIGIIGDYDGRPSHLATQESIGHCADKIGVPYEVAWLPTPELMDGTDSRLSGFDGLWCAPGSPYQSMWGAVNAIRYARENNIPFIGTCGGFQHAAIEYARNVLKLKEVQNNDFDPYSPNPLISALSCSLLSQTRQITLDRSSGLYQSYGSDRVEERYNCSFALTADFQRRLEESGFRTVGSDEEGAARILTIEDNTFYVVTLFQPQLSSTRETPHPLILEFFSHAAVKSTADERSSSAKGCEKR